MSDDWRAELRLGLERVVDAAVTQGVAKETVYEEVAAALVGLREADQRDPDPAEDGAVPRDPEPANDWPGAEGR